MDFLLHTHTSAVELTRESGAVTEYHVMFGTSGRYAERAGSDWISGSELLLPTGAARVCEHSALLVLRIMLETDHGGGSGRRHCF